MKQIIFDLDGTLIMWKDEYWNTLNKTLEYFNIDYNEDIINNLIRACDDYESKYDTYDYDNMRLLMEEYSNIKLPNEFIKRWTIFLEDCYDAPTVDLIEILEYLSNKYDLVILTNWFFDEQVNRLKKMNIDKYFKRVIATEKIKNKPNKEAYLEAIKPYDISECVMIGDSIKTDIEGALSIGLDAILYDYKNKYDNLDYKKVTRLIDLKKYL